MKDVVTAKEAADALGDSYPYSSFIRHVKQGRIPADYYDGERYLFTPLTVERVAGVLAMHGRRGILDGRMREK